MKKFIIFSRISSTGQEYSEQTSRVCNLAVQYGYPPENHIIIEEKESGIKLTDIYCTKKSLFFYFDIYVWMSTVYYSPPKHSIWNINCRHVIIFFFFTSFHGTFSKNASIIFRRNSEFITWRARCHSKVRADE